MKKIILSFAFLVVIAGISTLSAQMLRKNIKGDKNIVKMKYPLSSFERISASGIDHIVLITGVNGENSVVVETDQNLQEFIKPQVKNNTLSFSYKNISPSELKFYVSMSQPITEVEVSGASTIKNTIPIKGEIIHLRASGAANTKLILNYSKVFVNNSGAAHTILAGKSTLLSAELSGASGLNAVAMDVDSLLFVGSGVSTAKARVSKYVQKEVSGTSHLNLVSLPGKNLDVDTKNKVMKIVKVRSDFDMNDTTNVNIGTLHVQVVDGDSTKINVGNRVLIVDDRGNVKWTKKDKSKKFRGHWSGIDLGFNGYVNPQFNSDFGLSNSYLSLRFEKSMNVNLNLLEQSISFNQSKTIGLVTGLGLSFNDYRFSNPTFLVNGEQELKGYFIKETSVRKSKLSATYLSLPLLFEVQNGADKRGKRFFMSIGVIGNVKLRSHTKIYFNDANDTYFLQDPATGNYLNYVYSTPDNNNRSIIKNKDSYYLNPFRIDATVRIGFPLLSLYASYGLTPMFQVGKGPDVHQWSVGLALINW
ncbi:MAG: DUF2807 domain-containing protein [Bacteroidales bacterium]|nr:DUF2807 domain-containing protein [Bacteroidales bacterium]